jgi:hypothetical protein
LFHLRPHFISEEIVTSKLQRHKIANKISGSRQVKAPVGYRWYKALRRGAFWRDLGVEASPADVSPAFARNATGVHGCSDQSSRDVYALKRHTELKRLQSAQPNREAPRYRTPPGIDVTLHLRARRSCYNSTAGSRRAYIASMAQIVVVDRGILPHFQRVSLWY